MKRKLISLFLSLTILGVGVLLGTMAWRNKPAEPEQVDAAKTDKVPNVVVRVLEKSTVEDKLALTGSLMPWEEVVLSAEVPGKIQWKGVEEGDTVKEGQELFRIDTVSLEAKRDELQAQMALAAQEHGRLRDLAKAGIAPKQDLDRATAQPTVTKALLRNIDIQLSKSVTRAGFAGVVDRVYKERDEYIDSGAPLVRIVQVDRLKVLVGIPERDIVHFHLDDPVAVTLDALPGRMFEGRIYRIAPTAEAGTHTFATEVVVENPDGVLRPGMIARAGLVRASYPDSIKVPVFSVITMNQQYFTFVEEGGVARMRTVGVGVFLGEEVQITEGLTAGDRLIVVGQRELRDGAPVAVQEVQE